MIEVVEIEITRIDKLIFFRMGLDLSVHSTGAPTFCISC